MKIFFFLFKTSVNFLSILFPKPMGRYAFKKFCTPNTKPLNLFQLEFLEKGRDERFVVKENEVQTYQWGNGPTRILLIHGWASNTFRWKAYIENFDKGKYTIHAVDAFAHGLSKGKMLHVPLYTELIDEYIKKIGRVDYLIGHSIGGFTATYYLHKYKNPDIKKVVVMAAPGKVIDFFTYAENTLGFSKNLVGNMKKNFNEHVGNEAEYFNSSEFAKTIETPCLIIHDEDDKDTLIKNSEVLHKNWKNSHFIRTKDKGHNLKGIEVFEMVDDFLGKP